MCKITSLPNPHIYWVVIFVHVYIIILGLIMLILASINLGQFSKVEAKVLTDSTINTLAVVLGLLIIIAGCIGIILVILWKWKYLAGHSSVTLIIAIIVVLSGIYYLVFFNKDSHVSHLQEKLTTQFGGQGGGNIQRNSTAFANIQRQFKCCGLNSWRDYRIMPKDFSIPVSCCKTCESGDKLHFNNENQINLDRIWTHGCLMKLLAFSTMTVIEMRMFFLAATLPILQTGILLAILAHFIRYRYI